MEQSNQSCISLTAFADTPYIPAQLVQDIHGVLSVDCAEGQVIESWHIVLAIDISGSMTGGKIEAVISSVMLILEHLRDADRVSIIQFNDQVTLLTETPVELRDGRATLCSILKNISVSGCTNITDAIIQSVAVARRRGCYSQIIMFTDGVHNAGSELRKAFDTISSMPFDRKIPINTFSVGPDPDAKELMKFASATGGDYAHVESTNQICGKLLILIDNIATTVSTNCILTMTARAGGRIVGVNGVSRLRELVVAKKYQINVGSMYIGRSQKIMCRLSVRVLTDDEMCGNSVNDLQVIADITCVAGDATLSGDFHVSRIEDSILSQEHSDCLSDARLEKLMAEIIAKALDHAEDGELRRAEFAISEGISALRSGYIRNKGAIDELTKLGEIFASGEQYNRRRNSAYEYMGCYNK